MTATKTTTATLTALAKITATDRRDAASALADAGIDSTPGANRATTYPLFAAVRCLVDRKDKGELAAAELHHIAGAKLKDAQRAKIEREYIPIGEARRLAAKFATMTCDWLDNTGLPMAEQNRLMERLQEMAAEVLVEASE